MGEVIEPEVTPNADQPPASNFISDLLNNRYLQIGAGVAVAIIIFLVIFVFLIRGALPSRTVKDGETENRTGKKYTYVKVFDQLTPMDAAHIREALSLENIPFKSEKKGRVVEVSVAKKFADEARIKMAMLGLPEGGVVGFEIFDKSQSLGATDYERRIQYVRAVSGELSRIISHMKGINTARVQIVIPEQRPFGERIPGSASVLLNIKNKVNLPDKQIKGIMHLVASSVEDIKPEDVTVVDNTGTILSDRVKGSILDQRQSFFYDLISSAEDEKKSPLELLLKFKDQQKKSLETEFNNKIKQLLTSMFPAGSYLVMTNVSLKESEKESTPFTIEKIDVAVILDANNRDIKFTNQLKLSTMSLIASAIGYEEGRDTILVERQPFMNIESDKVSTLFAGNGKKNKVWDKKNQTNFIFKFIYAFVLITIIFIVVILRFYNTGRRQEAESREDDDEYVEEDRQLAVEKFKAFVQNNESMIIDKLVTWLE
ncbi:MAG: flagellar basal-body MS-ring/collar protein FliF [Candidatus Margulisbacteria bacterium]|nr:flagellar basal-body MS-ring/collar protein FliF [Candidatus Margulisiibacteriota bacterium]